MVWNSVDQVGTVLNPIVKKGVQSWNMSSGLGGRDEHDSALGEMEYMCQ